MHGGSLFLQWCELLGRKAGGQIRQLFAPPTTFEQAALSLTIRIAEFEAHEKTVELRFRQWEGADLARRVLRGDDKEGFG